jgi:hypothetical protein
MNFDYKLWKKNSERRKRAYYKVSQAPIIDPCNECLLKVTCVELCDDKALFIKHNKEKKTIRTKIIPRRKRLKP